MLAKSQSMDNTATSELVDNTQDSISDGLSFEPGWLNNKRSLTFSVDPSIRFPTPKYKYSKEELLSVWRAQEPLAPDSTAYPIVTAEECLSPVNLLPPEQQEDKTAFRRASIGRGRGRGRGSRPLWADDDQPDSFVLGEKTLDRSLGRSVDEGDETYYEPKDHAAKKTDPLLPPSQGDHDSDRRPPKSREVPEGWMYRDPQGEVQGPFSTLEMSGWYDAGYFGPDLMIKRQFQTEFVSLRVLQKKHIGSPFVVPDEEAVNNLDEFQSPTPVHTDKEERVSTSPPTSHAVLGTTMAAPGSTPTTVAVDAHTPIITVLKSTPTVSTPVHTPAVPAISTPLLSQTPAAAPSVTPSAQTPAVTHSTQTPTIVPSTQTHTASTSVTEVADSGPTLNKSHSRRASFDPSPRTFADTSPPINLEDALFVERFGIAPKHTQQILPPTGQVFQQPLSQSQVHPFTQVHPQPFPPHHFAPPTSPLRRSDGLSQRMQGPPFHGNFPPDIPLIFPAWQGPGIPSHIHHADTQNNHGPSTNAIPTGNSMQPLSFHEQFMPSSHPFLDPQQQFLLQQQIMQQQFLQQERSFLQQQAQQAQARAQAQVQHQHQVQPQIPSQVQPQILLQAQTAALRTEQDTDLGKQEPLRRKSGIFLLDESGMAVQIATQLGVQEHQVAQSDKPASDDFPPPSLPALPLKEVPTWGQKQAAQPRRMSLREIQEEELRQQQLKDPSNDATGIKGSQFPIALSKSQGNVPIPTSEDFFWALPSPAPKTDTRPINTIQAVVSIQTVDHRRQSAPSIPFATPEPPLVAVSSTPNKVDAKESKAKNKDKNKVPPQTQAHDTVTTLRVQTQHQPQLQPQPPASQPQLQIANRPGNQAKHLPSLQEIQEEELNQQVQKQPKQQVAPLQSDLKKSTSQSEKKIVSLREIQEEELRQQQRRKEAEDIQRQELIKQQAALLAQQQAIKWGPSQSTVLDISKPLSLLQIQEEEHRKKERASRNKEMEERKREEDAKREGEGLNDLLWKSIHPQQPAPLSAVMKEQMAEKAKDATPNKEQPNKDQASVSKKEQAGTLKKELTSHKAVDLRQSGGSLRASQESVWSVENPATASITFREEEKKPSKQAPQPKQPAVKQAPTIPKPPSKKVPATAKSGTKAHADDVFFWDVPEKSASKYEDVTTQSSKTKQASQNKSGNSKQNAKVSAFGGPAVSSEFMEWCQKQLKSLTGNSDTTLAEFLVSLQTHDEVRAYIQEYVGSSDKVNNFASEFLRQREFYMLEQSVSNSKSGKKAASTQNNNSMRSTLQSTSAPLWHPMLPPKNAFLVFSSYSNTSIIDKESSNTQQDKRKRMQKLDPDMLGFVTVPRPVEDASD